MNVQMRSGQPIESRYSELVAGIQTDVGIQVCGESCGFLKEKTAKIESILKRIPGLRTHRRGTSWVSRRQ